MLDRFPQGIKYYFCLLAFGLVFLVSCSKSDDPEVAQETRLVEVVKKGSLKKTEIALKAVSVLGPQAAAVALLIQHDVDYYKVSYLTTTTDNQKIQASGVLAVPVTSTKLPLVSIQHGTLFNESDAPSYFGDNSDGMIAIAMAAAGFITAMPDYVGYGDSKNYPHPYEQASGLAMANVDFLLSLKEYFAENNTAWNNNLLIAGYSEGGFATMATQKLIEESYSSELNLKASSCGAGAYNKSLTVDKLMNETSIGDSGYNRSYFWVLDTYNRIYKLNRSWSDFFKEPYASQLNTNGYKAQITGSFNTLLKPDFVQKYNSGVDVSLKAAVADNDLINWKTNTPTILTHGDADQYVPFYNSQTAYDGLKAAGSPKVELKVVKGGTHSSSIDEFIMNTYLFFLNYKK